MDDYHSNLIAVANRIGVRVTTPSSIVIGKEVAKFSALFHSFGGEIGIVADSDWSRIQPHAQTLISLGYGYSCVQLSNIDDDGMRDLLRDWGWCGATDERPSWM